MKKSYKIKKENKSQKPNLADYSLLTAQNLWQTHCQVLLIILLREFIKLNINIDIIIKNVKHVKLNTKIVGVV